MVPELKLNLSDSLADEAKSLRIALTPNVTGVYRHRAAGERPAPQAGDNQGIGVSVVNSLVRRNAAGLVVWSGRAICDSKQGIAGEMALKNGMGGKSREFNEKGSKLYAKT